MPSSYLPISSTRIIAVFLSVHKSARSARDVTSRERDTVLATSVSGVAAPREPYSLQPSSRPSLEISRPDVSRQNSMTSGDRAYRSTSATSPYPSSHPYGAHHSHRTSIGSFTAAAGGGIEARSPSFNSANPTQRYEEAALQRQELEAVKKENESLRQKIKDLERLISQGQSLSTAPSTTTP